MATSPRRRNGSFGRSSTKGGVHDYAASTMNVDDPAYIELVFGFVGPTGIDLDKVCDVLKSQLKAMQYETIEIRLSELISLYMKKPATFLNSHERIKTLMDRGTELREIRRRRILWRGLPLLQYVMKESNVRAIIGGRRIKLRI